MQPKKLIRSGIIQHLKEGEWETIIDQDELNKLYALKIREELAEIQESGHKDISEFADLLQVVLEFAIENGIKEEDLIAAFSKKVADKGMFTRNVLINLNPNNPSNKLYFEQELKTNSCDHIRESDGMVCKGGRCVKCNQIV